MVANSRNEIHGNVHGQVAQAHTIHQVIFSARPAPQALAGLPANPAEFAGRGAELDRLLGWLAPAAPVPVIAIGGLAGVGKTTLALRAAHQARENNWYPGGQLFLDLRGYDARGPLDVSAALASLLEQLGVLGEHIPAERPGRESLYRSQLAERVDSHGAVLLVLDNASSADQVRPLLPGHPGNRTLITSRHSLAELSARQFSLDVLEPDAAVELVRQALANARSKDARVAEDHAAARALSELCGRLPLALRIVAAILIDDEDLAICDLVAELEDTSTRLGGLEFGDSPGVRAAFELSYLRLADDERRLFRLLSMAPGPHFGVTTAAALAGITEARARKLLRSLRRAHMVQPTGTGRLLLHDLVWLYAVNLTNQAERESTITRVLDYYVETAAAADNQLRPAALRKPALRRFTALTGALEWLAAEWTCVVSALSQAYTRGRYEDTRDLAFTIAGYLDLSHRWDIWEHTQHWARAACRDLNDMAGECRALNMLGTIAVRRQHWNAALKYHQSALDIARRTGDRYTEAVTLNNLGNVRRRFDPDAALEYCLSALEIQRESDDRHGEATTLNTLGSIFRESGGMAYALAHHEQSLRIYRDLGDLQGQAFALNNIGNDHYLGLGRADQAIPAFEEALALHRQITDTYGAAQTLYNLGLACPSRVDEYWQDAITAFTECGAGQAAEQVRRQLITGQQAN